MLGEDLSGRFDYLFEPLEVDESAGDGDDLAPRALAEPENSNRWSSRMTLAGVVLATLAAAAATAIALMQPAETAPQVVIPGDSAPPSTTVSPVASTPVPTTAAELAPVLPATVSTSADVGRDTDHGAGAAAATGTDDRCQRAPRHDASFAHHARPHQRQPRITPAVSQPDSAQEERTGRRATRRNSLADGSRTPVRRKDTAFRARNPGDHADILPTPALAAA
jgi:hypothetical protein